MYVCVCVCVRVCVFSGQEGHVEINIALEVLKDAFYVGHIYRRSSCEPLDLLAI